MVSKTQVPENKINIVQQSQATQNSSLWKKKQSFLYDCELICKQTISLAAPCPLSLPMPSASPLFSSLME